MRQLLAKLFGRHQRRHRVVFVTRGKSSEQRAAANKVQATANKLRRELGWPVAAVRKISSNG